jgi:putative oxidoreductase
MLPVLLRRSMNASPQAPGVAWGLLLLRVAVGGMVFWIHGVHKLEGGLEYLRDGTPWRLAEEVAAMHTPAPVAAAFAATAAQLVCPLFLVAGLLTRCTGAILTVVLGVAVLQNVLADRDPQLALLYVLAVATLALTGGGRWSLDAVWTRGTSVQATAAPA